MNLITVYARREPTTDATTAHALKAGAILPATRYDVQVYRDPDCTKRFARFSWWQSGRPDRRYKRITLNCFRWALQWMPDAPAIGAAP